MRLTLFNIFFFLRRKQQTSTYRQAAVKSNASNSRNISEFSRQVGRKCGNISKERQKLTVKAKLVRDSKKTFGA